MAKVSVIIPARWSSTRFPGKPLANICGQPMIEWVYEAVSQCEHVDQIWVATDDERIFQAVEKFGGNAAMTSAQAQTGTDRILEALANPELVDSDIVINVQGDEPLIPPQLIDQIIETMKSNPDIPAFTAATPLDVAQANDANIVKVVLGQLKNFHKGLYFSRAAIPFLRNTPPEKSPYHQHIGLYGFWKKSLQQFHMLPESSLEKCESLEQLRMLENGWDIGVILTNYKAVGVDTPHDIGKVENSLNAKKSAPKNN